MVATVERLERSKTTTALPAAVGDVTDFAVGVEGDAVGSVESADGADEFAAGGVDGVDVIAAGDVDAMRRRVDQQIIPAAGVGELPVVKNFVGSLCLSGDGGCKKSAQQGCGKKGARKGGETTLVLHVRLRVGSADREQCLQLAGASIVPRRH